MTQSPSDRLAEADRLVQQAFQQWNTSLQAALQSLQRALSIYQEIGVRKAFPKKSREQEGSVFIAIGDVCASLRQYSQALESYQQALEIAKEVGNRQGKGMALSGGGAIYQNLGQYPQALSYYQQALDIAKEVGNRKEEGRILHGLGEILSKLEQYPKALDYYQQAVVVAQEIGDREAERRSLDAMRVIHNKLEHRPSALGKHQQQFSTRQAEAEQLLRQGQELFKTSQFQAAMQFLQQALEIYREVGDRGMEGSILEGIGRIYEILGQYPQALESLQQALEICKMFDAQVGEDRILNNIESVYDRLRQNSQALEFDQQAFDQTQSPDIQLEATQLLRQGMQQLQTSQFRSALQTFQEVLLLYQQAGDRVMESTTLTNIGLVCTYLGQYQQALEFSQQALAIRKEIGFRAGECGTLNNIGLIYYGLRRYAQALKYYQQSLAIIEEVNAEVLMHIPIHLHLGIEEISASAMVEAAEVVHQFFKSTILNNIGDIYTHLGQYQRALSHYQQALALVKELGVGYREIESKILNNLGILYQHIKQYTQAVEYFQQSLIVCREIGNWGGEGSALSNLGTIYRYIGQYSQAMNYYEQSLPIMREVGNRVGEGEILRSIGGIYIELKQYSQALAYFQQALAILREVSDRTAESFTLSDLGLALLRARQPEAAIEFLFDSVKVLESLRSSDLSDTDKVSLLDTQLPVYDLLQRALIAQNQSEKALEVSERGRARAFIDLISRRILLEAVNLSVAAPTIEKIKQIAYVQNTTLVQYSLVHTSSLNWRRMPQPSHLHIWVIKPTGEIAFRSVDLTTSETSLSSLIALSRETIGIRGRGYSIPVKPIRQPAQAKLQLQQLYQILIEPIADLLPADSFDRIIFIPQGELFLVPFAALQDTHGSYLIQTHTILTAPSIQVLSLTRQLQQDRTLDFSKALIVGNPTMPALPFLSQSAQLLPALPRAEQEAIAIAQKLQTQPLIGDAATETVVVQHMADASVIHLATHSLLEYGDPKASGVRDLPGAIVLACSEQDDGLLTSSKILNLKLHANLVVLSACDTGRGYITGDGVIGLSRALISAGASSVVVSLWKVADESTEKLMVEFYRQLQQHTDKAQALRQAMLKTMQQYPDPIDWAAFTLIGEAE